MSNKEARIRLAMQHPDRLGAGAKLRRKYLRPKERGEAVMKEFIRHTLRSGSGQHVTNPAQAKAIAASESKS